MSEYSTKDDGPDTQLTAVYRVAANEAPPPALDAAILAAAHREAGARPRALGFSFRRTARAALSIAAVIVLSVSLVTLMREEAPEVVSSSAEQGAPAAAKEKSVEAESNNAVRDDWRADAQTPKSLGLKPSSSVPSSGLAMPPRSDHAEPYTQTSRDKLTSKIEPPFAGQAPKRRDQFAGDPPAAGNNVMRTPAPQRQPSARSANEEIAQAPAAPAPSEAAKNQAPQVAALGKLAESKTAAKPADSDRETDSSVRAANKDAVSKPMAAVAPAAAPPAVQSAAGVAPQESARSGRERASELAPDKWLERIEDLRKQGKLDEARASLAEFRKRYPDYRLPESLRSGIKE